jgi:hypothetical protein
MGFPMILYGLVDLVNASFEDAGTPTGWDTAASVDGINAIDAAVVQSAGDGLPSTQSLKQNVASGAAGAKAITRQRIAIGRLPGFVKEGIVEVGVVASLKVARGVAARNAVLSLAQYDATGTSAPGSGALLAPPQERRFECGGPDWSLRVAAHRIHASTAYIDVAMTYDIALGAYDATADAWWDRVMLGVLIDMHKGFRTFDIDVDAGYDANQGNGFAEIVRTSKPSSKIDVDISNLIEGVQSDATQFEQFARWLGSPEAGFLAIWGDRDQLTNARRHFQMAYQDPSYSIEYPPGLARRNYSFRFHAPSETP